MKFKTIIFPKETVEYITPSWAEMQNLVFAIAQKIMARGEKFDRIITLAKGGWPMTRSLVDFLQVDKVASVGVRFYGGINEHLDRPSIYQDLPVSVRGEKVLLFDDVADTGESLKFVIDYLQTKGTQRVTTATLFYKPHSRIIPNYYGAKVSEWIIFPYDVAETIKTLGTKWYKLGMTTHEIKKRFEKLGFENKIVAYYF